jgi:hypothetical protein
MFAMPGHRGYYGALKVPHQQRPTIAPRADYPIEEDAVAALRAAYEKELQGKVDSGRINLSEKAYRLSRLENGEPIATQRADAALQNAREIAALARAHEATQQAKILEREGPEL